jgi:hypothetical protein
VDERVEAPDNSVQQLQLSQTGEESHAAMEQQPSPYSGEETDTQLIEPAPSERTEQPEAADTAV